MRPPVVRTTDCYPRTPHTHPDRRKYDEPQFTTAGCFCFYLRRISTILFQILVRYIALPEIECCRIFTNQRTFVDVAFMSRTRSPRTPAPPCLLLFSRRDREKHRQLQTYIHRRWPSCECVSDVEVGVDVCVPTLPPWKCRLRIVIFRYCRVNTSFAHLANRDENGWSDSGQFGVCVCEWERCRS